MILRILLFVTYFTISSRALKQNVHTGGRLYQGGSSEAAEKQFPFMAYIIGDDGIGCSATIPSPSTTLTTAHCIVGDKSMMAWAGCKRLRRRDDFLEPTQHRRIVRVAVPQAENIDIHDIGVAWVNDLWNSNEYLKPIPIWFQTAYLPYDFHRECLVIGFGFDGEKGEDRVLRSMNQTIGNSIVCPSESLQELHQIMCSMDILEKTICLGDNGGPVIIKMPLVGNVQIGIIKSQMPNSQKKLGRTPRDTSDPTCAVPAATNLYTFVGFYRFWLLKVIKDWPEFTDFWEPAADNGTNLISGTQQRIARNEASDDDGKDGRSSCAVAATWTCLMLVPWTLRLSLRQVALI